MKKSRLLTAAVLSCVAGVFGMVTPVMAEHVTTLNEVIVTADRDQIKPVASGMVGTVETAGTLGTKDVLDMPVQQVTFSRKALDTFSQPNRSVMDTLSLSPSVTVSHGSYDSNINIRGFSAGGGSWILNGIPSMSHQMTMPDNFIENISVLSGPNIGVNGVGVFMSGSVGGTVSATTKKAYDKPNTDVKLSWASDSYFTQAVDVGRRFGDDNEWGIRVNAQNSNGDLAVDGVHDKKRDIYINIDHRAKRSKTNLFMGYDYDNVDGRSNTINLAGSLKHLPRLPRAKNNLSPKWSNDKYENYTFILNHEQYLSDDLTWFMNAGYRKEDYDSWLQQWSGRVLQDYEGNYKGTYTQMPVFHRYYYVNTGFKGNFWIGDWKNEWIASVDKTWFSRRRDNNVSAANKYSVTGNIYKNISSPKPPITYDPITKQYTTQMVGWTLMDTISSPDDKLHLTLGYHGHKVDTQHHDDKSASGRHDSSDATAPILALAYKFTPNFSFFADHMENFVEGSTVGAGYTNNGEMLAPSKTKQNEFGFKYKTGDFLSTLSFYEIKKASGMGVPNGDGTERYVLDGEEKHKGVEYSIAGDINDKLSVIWGIGYMDAKTTKTYKGRNNDRRVNCLPKWKTDLALVYKPADNWNITGRLSYTGSTLIRNTSSYASSIRMPSVTLFDLGVSYDTKIAGYDTTFSAYCYNLFDKHYWYGSGTNAIGLGAPRTYAVTMAMHF